MNARIYYITFYVENVENKNNFGWTYLKLTDSQIPNPEWKKNHKKMIFSARLWLNVNSAGA